MKVFFLLCSLLLCRKKMKNNETMKRILNFNLMRQQQKHYDERIKCCVFFVSKKVESNALVHVHVQIIINWFINFTCMSLFSCCFHSSRHIHIRNMKLSRCYYEKKNYSFCCCIFSIFSHWRIREKNRWKCLFVLLDNGGIETDCETFYSSFSVVFGDKNRFQT